MYGVHAMPSMDALCFLSKDTARINFISVTTVDRYDYELAKKRAKTFIETKNKLRYSVVEILGDYYWKDNHDIERLVELTTRKMPVDVKNERELEKFVNEEINKPIPLDHPQWLIWVQEDYNEKQSLIIYKQHHSMCDGISCMNFHIG